MFSITYLPIWILCVTLIDSSLSTFESNIPRQIKNNEMSPKLLVLMLDGFRWDYLQTQNVDLHALRQFVSEGVQTQWVEPIFPSLSYPNWITMSTGLFAENHGILGNFMLDRGNEKIPEAKFTLLNLTTTSDPRWWKNIEPIWVSATKENHKVLLSNWALCNVTFSGIYPDQCSEYKNSESTAQLRENLQNALELLSQDFSFAMVYEDVLDNTAHYFGPDSYQAKFILQSIDSVLNEFESNLRNSSLLSDQLNVIIVSDHGMTNMNKDVVKYIFLEDFINTENVYQVVDFGCISTIAAVQTPNAILEIYNQLQSAPGIDVYRKEDIPEEFHYKNHPFVLDLLLVAKPGYAIVGVNGSKQFPDLERASKIEPYLGNHGYYNMTDMRGIFFARGPAFKKGYVHTPINMEDEYQMLAKILEFSPLPHNGSWERVAGLFQ